MTGNLSIVELVMGASIIVKLVLALLILASLTSWAIILRKRAELGKARTNADKFEHTFWSGGDLTAMFRAIDQSRRVTQGMEALFEAGFREFTRMRQQGGYAPDVLIEGCRRAMRVALLRETDRLEKSLSTLATVGSISPYVGLFGTVWGIMNAFSGLGNVQQATLAMVAPGIAEALVATAVGLFAAIPAVIAYNRFADQVSRIELRYDSFMDELTTILQRHSHTRSGAAHVAEVTL